MELPHLLSRSRWRGCFYNRGMHCLTLILGSQERGVAKPPWRYTIKCPCVGQVENFRCNMPFFFFYQKRPLWCSKKHWKIIGDKCFRMMVFHIIFVFLYFFLWNAIDASLSNLKYIFEDECNFLSVLFFISKDEETKIINNFMNKSKWITKWIKEAYSFEIVCNAVFKQKLCKKEKKNEQLQSSFMSQSFLGIFLSLSLSLSCFF